MKKINIIIIILLIIPFQQKAQRQQVIEPTNLECWYSLVVIRDTIDRSLKIDDTMILKIGKTHSLFYSYYTFYNDSLRTDPVGKQIAIRMTREAIRKKDHSLMPMPRSTDDYIYKSYPKPGNNTTFTRLEGKNGIDYFEIYEDGDNRQKWIIQQDSVKQIAGYPCQLGYCHFRGRTWKAWFTTDIPVSNGPWKLAGLPGLILEAYDSAYHYHYTLTEIRKQNLSPICLYNFWEQQYEKLDRIKFQRLRDRRYEETANDRTHAAYKRQETD